MIESVASNSEFVWDAGLEINSLIAMENLKLSWRKDLLLHIKS
jgi:hypothetical protein